MAQNVNRDVAGPAFEAHSAAAGDLVERERTLAAAERDAFAAFRERVARIEPSPLVQPSGLDRPPIGTITASNAGGWRDRVLTAYRETVLDVPHHESEYGDTTRESLESEFGPDVASVLAGRTPFTDHVRETLLRASERARDSRDAYLDALASEAELVCDAERTVQDIARRLVTITAVERKSPMFDTSLERRERLCALEARCETLALDRQTMLRRRPPANHGFAPHVIVSFVYGSLPVQYPVLADIARLADRIRTARRRFERVIAHW